MNEKQRENISKLLYDLIKLTYIGLIIGGVISPKGVLVRHVITGIVVSIILFVIAYWLDRRG